MQTVDIHEAKTHPARFVDQAAAGEENPHRPRRQASCKAGAPGKLGGATPRIGAGGKGVSPCPAVFRACTKRPSGACSKPANEHAGAGIAAGHRHPARRHLELTFETVIPSRKATRDYLMKGDANDED
jgi:hypothetical protein